VLEFWFLPPTDGPVAQLAEQQTLNLRVEGSIPSWLTISLPLNTLRGFPAAEEIMYEPQIRERGFDR
jgi:hypothetical protein